LENNIYDTIIIGSGISGMAAGIVLAKEGEQTLVLEQHSIAGGMTQTYSRKGKIFPTGVHRLGSLNPGQPLWYFFTYLDIMEKLDLVELSDDCFEKIFFPSKNYSIPSGHDNYQRKLIEFFPDQEKSIATYFSDLKHVISNIGMYDPSVVPQKDLSLNYSGPLKEYLVSIGISGRLKSLLTANSPFYGLSSGQCPLLTHFIVSNSYLNSSFRINEKKTPFSKTLATSFESKGGKIYVNSHVKQLIIKDQTVTGVILDNNELFFSKKVIFSGHPSLILDLCPPEIFRPVYRNRLNHTNSPGIFGVALKWSKKTCPLEKNDVYIYDSWDVDYQYNRDNILKDDALGMVYLSALPDMEKAEQSDQSFAVTALTGMNAKEACCLRDYYKESKNNNYKAAKEKITQKVLNHIKQVFPDLLENIEVVDSFSPVTFQRYTLTKDGSAYGIQKTAQRFMEGMFSPATKIKNLFLLGQSIGFNGIHGSIVSSINLCNMLFGKEYLTNKIVQKQK